MSQSTFLLVPTGDPPQIEGLEKLDRAGRLLALTESRSGLDAEIRQRLAGLDVTFLEGAGMWTADAPTSIEPDEMRRRLAGLPIEVAEDSRFTTM